MLDALVRDPIAHDSRRAWVATVAASCVNGVAFGIAYSFGTFFDAMSEDFGTDRGPTALIFGITLLFFFGTGIVTGPIGDRVGARRFVLAGGAVFALGLVISAQVEVLWLGYLTYGIGVGVGGGSFVAPLAAHIGRLFVTHRPFALGVMAIGNGLGTLIVAPTTSAMVEAEGWRFAFVALAVAAGSIFAVGAVFIGPSPRFDSPLASVSGVRAMFSDPGFAPLFWSATLMSVGLYVAFAFVVPFAEDTGVSSSAAARLVGLIGFASIFGRLGLTALTSRVGAGGVYLAALGMQPVAYAIWLVADGRYAVLVVFALTLGTAYGGFVAVTPELAMRRFGLDQLGLRMGTLFTSFAIGGLIGPPIAGALADRTEGTTATIVTVIAVVAAAFVVALPVGRARDDVEVVT